jgi:DNA-directed RNA polymerase subunit RPC12/RpoP
MMEDAVVRCPYCMPEGHFRGIAGNEYTSFVCVRCGHMVVPKDRSFRCTCVRCWENDLSVYRYPRLASFAIDANAGEISRIPCKPSR